MKPTLSMFVIATLFCARLAPGAQNQDIRAPLPRPEHPQPQAVRGEWLNLNGIWEFAETDNDRDSSFLTAATFPDRIIVPFCRESKLSGLARTGFVKNVWYRRTFFKPANWKSPCVRLHIGACDWRTDVWINGKLVGTHTGGSAQFYFDITNQLKDGANTAIIHAFDDTRSGFQATGKQAHSLKSEGCVYTRTTGIWQTVWLEGVGSSYIRDFRLTPDVANSRVLLQAEVDGPAQGITVKAVASANGKVVGSAETPADWRNGQLVVNLSDKHLWSIDDPFLYDLKLSLVRGEQVIDELSSYFGLRDVSIRGAAILINGKAVFQRTVLDQGFYPEGIWTAPTDEALKNDIKLSQAVGFNGARLHQKVFEPRFLYWADKLGYIVWGEFPNWGLNYERPEINTNVINEWIEIVRRDRNHPAVIGWCPFNETPAQAGPLQNSVVHVTRSIDPSRPVIESSGYYHGVAQPDALDAHDYDQNPMTFRSRWNDNFGPGTKLPARYAGQSNYRPIPFFVSEYGGIGWITAGGWGYGNAPKTLDEFYARYQGLTDALLDSRLMFGYCYTQLYDIEQEQNGLYTYDRKPKFDCDRLKKIQSRQAAFEKDPPVDPNQIGGAVSSESWRVLVAAQPDGALAKEWRYTIDAPPASWMNGNFDDNAWKLGRAGFGQKGGWESRIKTPWSTKDIWLRQQFTCDNDAFTRAMFVIHYDNGTEIYINGKKVWKGEGWNDQYAGFDATKAVKAAIRKGNNTIAIHCHQDEGGQYIDAALLVGE